MENILRAPLDKNTLNSLIVNDDDTIKQQVTIYLLVEEDAVIRQEMKKNDFSETTLKRFEREILKEIYDDFGEDGLVLDRDFLVCSINLEQIKVEDVQKTRFESLMLFKIKGDLILDSDPEYKREMAQNRNSKKSNKKSL